MKGMNKIRKIIPLKDVVFDFFVNLWHIRLIIILQFFLILINYFVFLYAEGDFLTNNHSALLITIDKVINSGLTDFSPHSDLGKIVYLFNSIYGYFILGIIVWIVQMSISNHKLKDSKFLLF